MISIKIVRIVLKDFQVQPLRPTEFSRLMKFDRPLECLLPHQIRALVYHGHLLGNL